MLSNSKFAPPLPQTQGAPSPVPAPLLPQQLGAAQPSSCGPCISSEHPKPDLSEQPPTKRARRTTPRKPRLTDEQKGIIIGRFERGEIDRLQATTELGCSRQHFLRLRRTGSKALLARGNCKSSRGAVGHLAEMEALLAEWHKAQLAGADISKDMRGPTRRQVWDKAEVT